MSWSLKGSYVETCSCELMCPCNLSFDHGATYDFCRVTLVFNIREGEVEGTDVGGLKVAADRRHAEGDDRRATGGSACSSTSGRPTSRPRSSSGSSAGSSAGRWPALAPLVGRDARRRAGADRGERRRPAPQRPRRATRSTSRSRTSCRSASRRASRSGSPACSTRSASDLTMAEAKRSRINALRHRVRGQDRAFDVRVLLGRLSRDRLGAGRAAGGAGSRPPSRPRAPGSGSSPCSSRSPRVGWWSTVDRMRGMDDGPWTAPRDARLVPRRLGRDDGRDDVPVGRADGRAVLAHDQRRARGSRRSLFAAGYLVTWAGRRGCSRSPSRGPAAAIAGDVLAWDRAGRWVAGGDARSSRPSTS